MKLSELRKIISKDSPSAALECPGLSDDKVAEFQNTSLALGQAIANAATNWSTLSKELKAIPADKILNYLQEDILNFYSDDNRAPYIPLAGKGPWVITSEGAVIYETGGYGMLGFGHAPDTVMEVLSRDEVMANVMTGSFAQRHATDLLQNEIGSVRGDCPYDSFCFLNSGSEANNFAIRLAELYASTLKGRNSPEGKKTGLLCLKKGFHGRTDAPAKVSDSSMKAYKDLPMLGKLLDDIYKVEMDDIAGIRAAFQDAEKNNTFICAAIIEPVMGEGNAGYPMSPEFYGEMRKITKENNCILIVDSVQAGYRAHGVLSIVDYPGIKSLEAPDLETFSKAISGGQFPVSMIALSKELTALSESGPVVYGNTMTANPKAMNVISAILKLMTPEIKKNISEAGSYFLKKLSELVARFPDKVESAQGTGLLISLKLKPEIPVEGKGGVEERMRRAGVNVIHASGNSLRFTPHFGITKEEVDLVVDVLVKTLT